MDNNEDDDHNQFFKRLNDYNLLKKLFVVSKCLLLLNYNDTYNKIVYLGAPHKQHWLQNEMGLGIKKLSFKIGESKHYIFKNRETNSAFKP